MRISMATQTEEWIELMISLYEYLRPNEAIPESDKVNADAEKLRASYVSHR